MKKMVAKADNFIDMMKHAEGACKESSGRNVADFDDDIDRTVKWVVSQRKYNLNVFKVKAMSSTKLRPVMSVSATTSIKRSPPSCALTPMLVSLVSFGVWMAQCAKLPKRELNASWLLVFEAIKAEVWLY